MHCSATECAAAVNPTACSSCKEASLSPCAAVPGEALALAQGALAAAGAAFFVALLCGWRGRLWSR